MYERLLCLKTDLIAQEQWIETLLCLMGWDSDAQVFNREDKKKFEGFHCDLSSKFGFVSLTGE